jgi:hypothetical protein
MSDESTQRQQNLLEVPRSAKRVEAGPASDLAEGVVCLRPFREWEPDQGMLLPQFIRDEWGTDHLACFFLELRQLLDFSAILARYTGDRGQPAYHPVMMTLLLMYAYAVGVVSSRKISRMCQTDLAGVAPILILDGRIPVCPSVDLARESGPGRSRGPLDSGSRCSPTLEANGYSVPMHRIRATRIELARQMGFVRLGHIAVDGSKFEANASKHKAMSYERMPLAMKKLEEDIDRLLKEAEAIDAEEDRRYGKGKRGDELPPGLSGPGALAKAIKKAKEKMEADKKRELAAKKKRRLKQIEEAKDELEKQAREKAKQEGKEVIKVEPAPKAQRNFTDPESRIMPKNQRTFLQAFNAQLAVEAGSQIIVAQSVGQSTNDANQLSPMVEQVVANTGVVPEQISADSGYFDEKDIEAVESGGSELFVATERQKHGAPPLPPRGRMPAGLSFKERMQRKLLTRRGRQAYARRKVTVEPTIGQIKNRTTRRFSMRGLFKAGGEFSLICAVHNLLKLFSAARAAQPAVA